MFFRHKKNRRRLDVAKKTGELKAAAKHHAPTVLKVAALLLVSVGVSWGSWQGYRWATTTERFALRQVVFAGNARATEAELLRLGGLSLGLNLFAIDVRAVERALGTHPWVKSVLVRRQLPERLSVEIVEHRPVALLALGELYLVNEVAEPFKRVKATDAMDLPLITGIDRDGFLSNREAALGKLQRAVEVTDTYATSAGAKAEPLSEVHVSADGVAVITTSGQEIRFAEGELTQSLERLQRIRAELKSRALSAEVIRLDNRARPNWVSVQLSSAKSEKTEQSRK
jgi:cell division protein FtsQ